MTSPTIFQNLIFLVMSDVNISYLITGLIFESTRAGVESGVENTFVARIWPEPIGPTSRNGCCHGWLDSESPLAIFDFAATNTELSFRIQPRSGGVNIRLTKACHLNGSPKSIVYEGICEIGRQRRFVRATLIVVGQKFFYHTPPSIE